ncbi:Adaptor protein complex AP-3 delta subunit [Anaeromyces robustus]|uniref:AP-3 complex subunit delta n=1 Tax=Anaeromyces robustus TaxID=1754192 RepID=A0A1Y1XR76_9FUNG|nr:Adaptor protein complex AP-3 delta subunit [Anaeromyces robustus]|eukprot:ORX88262.1 Adaptor protein complex AP-3 delta subunit [Anaeromyces robustus]
MFEKSLADLIRGIRANKKNEASFIASCLEEITTEIKSNDIDVKAVALQKLTYLNMMGYDMTWASFHVVEVMSSSKFQYKRIGYLAAAQSFNKDTDVLMLCTNLIKKDLASNKMYETALALNGLSQIVTPDLARDLIDDLLKMMNHSQPYIRKRVVVLLYKVFLQYPEALIMSYPKLKDKLEDQHTSVVIATVSVICELATHNPRNYLPLVPQLYNILSSSNNNWLSIKIVKLFALLAPEEPRLAKKILPVFGLLLESTSATSFAYEILNSMIKSGLIKQANQSLIALSVEKLKEFIVDRDANLRYLGLSALSELITIFPQLVTAFTDIILERLDDIDLSIRRKALDLVPAMVTKPTLMPIVDKLMSYLFKEEDEWFNNINIFTDKDYRNCIVNNILTICSKDKYANITNFQWYIYILCNLAFVENISVIDSVAKQLMDVCIRLRDTPLKKFFIDKMVELLKNKAIYEKKFIKSGNSDILYVAAYLLGEYRSTINVDNIEDILFNLTTNEVKELSEIVQNSYIIAILKIYIYWVLKSDFNESSIDAYKQITTMLMDKLQLFIVSSDIEVQDRANLALEILNKIYEQYDPINSTDKKLIEGIDNLFKGELKPVAKKAQKMVPIPTELDLDKVINPESQDILNEIGTSFADETKYFWKAKLRAVKPKKVIKELSKRELEEARRKRNQSKKNNPFYLDFDEDTKSQNSFYEAEIDNIPIVPFTYKFGTLIK